MRKSTHTADYHALRTRLVEMRNSAGLSQRALAERIGVPHTWVAKVESGERRIDLIEFGWFCVGCGADAGEAATRLLAEASGKRGSRSPRTGRVKARAAR